MSTRGRVPLGHKWLASYTSSTAPTVFFCCKTHSRSWSNDIKPLTSKEYVLNTSHEYGCQLRRDTLWWRGRLHTENKWSLETFHCLQWSIWETQPCGWWHRITSKSSFSWVQGFPREGPRTCGILINLHAVAKGHWIHPPRLKIRACEIKACSEQGHFGSRQCSGGEGLPRGYILQCVRKMGIHEAVPQIGILEDFLALLAPKGGLFTTGITVVDRELRTEEICCDFTFFVGVSHESDVSRSASIQPLLSNHWDDLNFNTKAPTYHGGWCVAAPQCTSLRAFDGNQTQR